MDGGLRNLFADGDARLRGLNIGALDFAPSGNSLSLFIKGSDQFAAAFDAGAVQGGMRLKF